MTTNQPPQRVDAMKRRLSLRKRFVMGVAAMLLPLVLLGAGAVLSLRHMAAAFDEALDDPVQEMHAIMHLQSQLVMVAMPPNDYLIHGEVAEREKFSRRSAEVERAFEGILALVTLWPEQEALIQAARAEWQAARRIANSLLALSAPVGNPVAAREMKRMDAHIDRAADILVRAHHLTEGELGEEVERAHAIEHWTLLLIVGGIGVLGLIVAAGSGFLLARFVLVPLRVLEAGASRLGAGDLSHRVSVETGDELARLAGSFNAMAEKLEKDKVMLEELSTHDGLMGLYNHRTFYKLLEDELARAVRFKHPVSLLLLDIDHFKRVNDTHGHQAGDAILKGLSDLLVKQARAIDRVCRYGGEEITVILPETDATAAMNLAERLRAAVERQSFDIGGKTVGITVSIGVATYPQLVDALEKLVTAADTAMYAAKQGGRNRVERYEPSMKGGNSSS